MIFRIPVLLFIAYTCISHNQVSGQKSNAIDSLTSILESAKNDTNKVNILNELGWQYYIALSFDTSLLYATEARNLAEKLNFKKGLAVAHKTTGNNYSSSGKNKEALDQYNLSIKISKETGDKQTIAKCYANIANIHYAQGDYSIALEYYLMSMKSWEETGDKPGMAKIYSDLSRFYSSQGDRDEALRYNGKEIAMNKQIGRKDGITRAYLNTALILESAGKYSEALNKLDTALEYINDLNDKSLKASCFTIFGRLYLKRGNYYNALRYFNLSLDLIKESGHKYNISVTYGNLGAIYATLGDLPKALQYYIDALKICQEIGNKDGIANGLNSIGQIYTDTKNYPAALEHFTQSLEVSQEIGHQRYIASSYDGIGISYYEQADYSRALDYFQKELKIVEELDDKYIGTAHVYLQFGSVYTDMGNYSEALEYNNLALEKSKELGDIPKIARSYVNIASVNFLQAKSASNSGAIELYRKANEYFEKGLELTLTMKNNKKIKDIYRGLSLVDSALGRFDLAYEHHKLYTQYKDSLLNEDSRNKLTVLQIQYETEQKDKELALLNKENDIQALQISRQKIQRDGIIIIIAFLVVVGFLVFRSLHLRKKLEKQNAIFEERRRISADLHDDIGSGLSKISLLSEIVKEQVPSPETRREMEKIAGTSRELLDHIREIIWALNSNNDYLENLVSYIRWYASEYFDHSGVSLKLDEPIDIPQTTISGEYRRNVFYSVKEAMHNIVKHAEASEAVIKFNLEKGVFYISINDNGKGIPEGNRNRFGNGIKNIMTRMEAVRGNVRIESNDGTKITLAFPV